MEVCPRCGNRVEQLHALPAESLRVEVRERRADEGGRTSGMACRWCRNEVLEG